MQSKSKGSPQARMVHPDWHADIMRQRKIRRLGGIILAIAIIGFALIMLKSVIAP